MRNLLKYISPWVYSVFLFVIGTSIVLAADSYTNVITINILAGSTSYYNYPFIINLNNTQLSDLGYINSAGINTRVSRGISGTDIPYGMTGANLTLFVDTCLGNKVNLYSYKLGYLPVKTTFDIITGQGGYFFVVSNSSMVISREESDSDVRLAGGYDPVIPHEVRGDSMVAENSYVYLEASPKVLTDSGWVTVKYKLKALEGPVDVVFGFNGQDGISISNSSTEFYSNSQASQWESLSGSEGEVRAWVELPFKGIEPVSGEYFVGLKPSGISVSKAESQRDLWLMDPWYNYTWLYRKPITISPSVDGAQTNYTMGLIVGESLGVVGWDVNCNSNVSSTFSDLRFTTSNGYTLCSYWIQETLGVTPNQLALIWIKVPLIHYSPVNTTIYMYYGNALATSLSSGSATFGVGNFDDFEWGNDGDSITPSGGNIAWTGFGAGASTTSITTGTCYGGSRSLQVYRDGANDPGVLCTKAADSDYAIRYMFSKDNSTEVRFYHGDPTYNVLLTVGTDEYISTYDGYTNTTTYNVTNNVWQAFEVNNFNYTNYTYDVWFEGSRIVTNRTMWVNGWNDGTIGLTSTSGTSSFWIDNFIIRKWTVNEPSWGYFGPAEFNLPRTKSYWLSWKGYVDTSISGAIFSSPGYLGITSNGAGSIRVYEGSNILVSSPLVTGWHNITIASNSTLTYSSLFIDGNWTSSAHAWPLGTLTYDWLCESGPARDTQWVIYKVDGVKKLHLEPTRMLFGSTIMDESGSANYGYIVWGENPEGTSVTLSGMTSIAEYIMGPARLDPYAEVDIIPVPGVVNLSGDPEHVSTPSIAPTGYVPGAPDPMAGVDPINPGGLPVYELVARAAASLGWTPNTLYGILMSFTAIAMGAAAFIASGSLLGGAIMLTGTLAVASSTGVVPAWIPIILGLSILFIVVLSRSM